MAIKMTREEYRAKFGQDPDFSNATLGGQSFGDPGYLSRVASDVKGNVMEASDSLTSSAEGKMNPIRAGANIAKNVSASLMAPLAEAPGFKQVGKAFNWIGEKAVNTELGNKVTDKLSEKFSPEALGTASDLAETALNMSGVEGITQFGAASSKAARQTATKVGESTAKVSKYTKAIKEDVVPSAERVVEHQVSKALDLSPGDLNNISRSTGNEVGRWMADNNLIGVNKGSTQGLLKDFYKTNYEAVRTEIGKVKNTYQQYNVPRYVEALKALKKQVTDVPGMQKVSVEVDNLLSKKDISLADVQRVKELVDDHFNLYKVTGDVSESVTKQGLAQIRSDLKGFIESEVKNATGADIRKMNNNVSTARSIDDAITTRSPKGLTKSNLKVGDLGIFGIGTATGGPLFGLALLFGKKLLESPAVRLRIAKYLDSVSDARKAQMAQEMEAGKIPVEFNQFIRQKNRESSSSVQKQ